METQTPDSTDPFATNPVSSPRLFDERSEEIIALATSLALAQAEIEDAKKERENPAFRNRYATLGGVWDACREPLTKQGLSIVQLPMDAGQGKVSVKTILMHKSGQYITSTLTLPVSKPDAQGYGSAMTYARRYALMATVGVCPDDDDGNAAVGNNGNREQGNGYARNGTGNGAVSNTRPTPPQRSASQPQAQQPSAPQTPPVPNPTTGDDNLPMTEEQESAIRRLSDSLKAELPDMSEWTQKDARRQYAALKKQKEAQAQSQSQAS